MDDTQQSRTSDAAATRKRRSSILKSQRAPRAPLTELDFHPTTPTDTAKSRRVSFSRRTGVAEFVTNEATTTWKNVYEEQNKTFETSGNDSAGNAPRPSAVGHLGKHIFEDQFLEVELIDFGSNVNEPRGVENSINNVKCDQFAFECSADDRKLSAPGPHFERSAFTVSEQPSKLFGDDLAISGLGEISDKINADFSILQPVGDDLDEIQKDLQRHQANQQNFVCAGPQNGRNKVGYIEVDLNATHITVDCEANSLTEDMSITDTIHSPKVNVSKNGSSLPTDKCLNKDWVADKENIAVNPYIAPKESANFAINEIPDQVLVFDGKRLTLQSQREPVTDYRKTLISTEEPIEPLQTKTIVINVDDDLPNFVANPHTSMSQHSKSCYINETLQGNNCDISMTQPLLARIETSSNKRRTIVFANTSGDISMTQALPTNIAPERDEKRRTLVFDNNIADISVTQAIPANLMIPPVKKRQTMVFENEAGNISITQALPTNMILGNNPVIDKRKTTVFDNDDGNISVTKPIPSNILFSEEAEYVKTTSSEEIDAVPSTLSSKANKRNTIMFDDEDGNISITKAIPSNILISKEAKFVKNTPENSEAMLSIPHSKPNKRNTIMFEDEDGNISVTKAIPSNILISEEAKFVKNTFENSEAMLSIPHSKPNKRNTIMFEDEDGNISVTKAIPSNILISEEAKFVKNTPENSEAMLSIPHSKPNKRNTIMFEDEDGNISVTKAIPSNILISEEAKFVKNTPEDPDAIFPIPNSESNKRNTIMFEDEDSNIPSNILPSKEAKFVKNAPLEDSDALLLISSSLIERNKRKTIVFNDEDGNISITKTIPTNVLYTEEIKPPQNIISVDTGKRKTIVFDDDDGDISITKAIPSNMLFSEKTKNPPLEETTSQLEPNKRTTTILNDDDRDVSITKQIPVNIIRPTETKAFKNTFVEVTDVPSVSISSSSHFNTEQRQSIILNEEDENVSITKAIHWNRILPDQGTTKMDVENLSTNEALQSNTLHEKELCNQSHRMSSKPEPTMAYKDDINIFMTQALPSNIISSEKGKIMYQENSANISNTEPVPANLIRSAMHTTTSDINCIKISNSDAMSEMLNISQNDVEEMNKTTKKFQETSLSHELIPETIGGFQHGYCNESIAIKPESKSLSVTQAIPSELDFNTPATKEVKNLVENNATDIFVTNSALDSVNLREADSVIRNALAPTNGTLNKSNLERNDMSLTISAHDSNKQSIMKSTPNTSKDNNIIDIEFATQNIDMDLNFKMDSKSSNLTTIQDMNISNKNIQTIKTESNSNSTITLASDNNLFQITKDYEHVVKTENTDNGEGKNVVDHSLKTKENVETDLNDIMSKHITEPKDIESSLDKSKNVDISFNQEDLHYENKRKSYKNADCTKDLLDMLSKFTEEDDKENPIQPPTDACKAGLENKSILAPERLLSHPRRQSVVLSREDLMHHISMAQAMLQSSAASESETSATPDTPDTPDTPSPERNSRVSSEVVKTLHFEDDDSSSDPKDSTATTLATPLKETCPNKVSSQSDDAILTDLKDTSREIENLMNSFENVLKDDDAILTDLKDSSREIEDLMNSFEKSLKDRQIIEKPATCNNQVLANFKSSNDTEKINESSHAYTHTDQTAIGIIPIDLHNPLNNVPVVFTNLKDTSKYESYEDTMKPSDSAHEESIRSRNDNILLKDIEPEDNIIQSDSEILKNDLHASSQTISSTSSNCEMDVIYVEPQQLQTTVETNNVSTDDTRVNIKSKYEKRKHMTCSRSPHEVTPKPASKIAKRSVSPVAGSSDDSDRTKQAPYEITKLNQKPAKNEVVQHAVDHRTGEDNLKMKSSSAVERNDYNFTSRSESKSIDDDVNNGMETQGVAPSLAPQPATAPAPACTTIPAIAPAPASANTPATVSAPASTTAPATAAAPASATTPAIAPAPSSVTTPATTTAPASATTPAPAPAPAAAPVRLQEDADVRAAIDRLECIINGEVEWETRSDEQWSFLLLKKRFRLIVRLAPSRATRGRVRASTPVTDVTIEYAQPVEVLYKKNHYRALCLRFALESMRGAAEGAVTCAGHLVPATPPATQPASPGLVRRVAAVCRLATRWERAMQVSWCHLAYELTDTGRLTLSVANLPLRSVWALSMDVQLARDGTGTTAYPVACDVRVRALSAEVAVSEREVARAVAGVPANWGHVPTTLWKIFRYLKNRPSDDALMGGLTLARPHPHPHPAHALKDNH